MQREGGQSQIARSLPPFGLERAGRIARTVCTLIAAAVAAAAMIGVAAAAAARATDSRPVSDSAQL